MEDHSLRLEVIYQYGSEQVQTILEFIPEKLPFGWGVEKIQGEWEKSY